MLLRVILLRSLPAVKPAWEQELQDLDYYPDFLDGETVIRKVGRWINHVKKRLFGNW
jgi:hypothetical protein